MGRRAGVAVAALGLAFVAVPVAAETHVNADISTIVHNAAEQNVWETRIGTPIHAQALVVGWADKPYPTGQASYKFFKSLDCSGTAVNGASHALVTGSRYAYYDFSGYSYTPSTAVDLSVRVYYAGDTTYYSGYGDCWPIRVDKALATVRLTVHDEAHHATEQVYVGEKAHAAVEVVSRLAWTPTGSVTFRWFANGTCAGTPKYTKTTTLVGGRVDLASFGWASGSETVSAYQVRYAGDARYEARTSTCAPYHVVKATPHLTTQIHDALHNPVTTVPSAKPVHVALSLTGAIGAPTGTIYVESYAAAGCSGIHGELQQTAAMGIDPAGMAFGHPGPSSIWLRVRYGGDWRYDAVIGPCMRLDWLAAATPPPTASPPPAGSTPTHLPTVRPSGPPESAASSPAAQSPSPSDALPSASTGAITTPVSPAQTLEPSSPVGPSATPGSEGPITPSADPSPGATAPVIAALALVVAGLVGFGWWRRRASG